MRIFSALKAPLLLLALFAAALAPMPSMAQELAPEHVALARRYVDATDTAQVYEITIVQMGIETLNTLGRQNPDYVDEISDTIGTVIAGYRDSKGDLMDQFARIYAERLTMEELQLIVDFYESDVGRKLSRTNAQISGDIAATMQVFNNTLRTEFLARVRAELRTQDINL